MARSGIPLPRRGLRTFFIVVNLILGPYILVHWLSTINLSDRSDRNYLLARREVDFNKINSEPESHAEAWEEDDSGAGTPRKTVNRETIVVQQESEEIPSSQDDRKRLEEHKYDRNGLVLVNPNGRHPIYDLIKRAHKSWEQKVGKSSKTLKEAVDEYRRRYHRPPPRGFDRWWKYAQKHNVQLPDEYDQIHKDLEPFFAFSPSDLRKQVKAVSQQSGMYTITCDPPRGCTYDIVHEGLNDEGRLVAGQRAEAQMSLLEDIGRDLEPVQAVFYSHDVPWQFVGHEYRSALEDSAGVGEYYNTEEHDHDTAHLGWASACAPHKPIREGYDFDILPDLESTWSTSQKSFIWDHKATMDPCVHPTLTHTVGFLSGHGKGPGPSKDIYPVMAMCKTTLHSDVLAVSMEAWTEDVGDDPSWEEKTDQRMLWRGKTTGIYFKDGVPWNISQRATLVDRTARTSGDLPVLPVTDPELPLGYTNDIEMSILNDDLVDVAFVDEPIQCDPDTCDDMKKMYHFGERKDWSQGNQYKYLLDIDGNGWSARFKRLMSTNSAILKSTIFPEWYTDRVQPWIHYIPIKADLTDLYDVLSFFRGNDLLARDIAVKGKEWSKTFWRKEDMVAYQFRLFLELSRLLSSDRDKAAFHLGEEMIDWAD